MRFSVRWLGRSGVVRRRRDMGGAEVQAFLQILATERHVSVPTHNQALGALLFLHREVSRAGQGLSQPAHHGGGGKKVSAYQTAAFFTQRVGTSQPSDLAQLLQQVQDRAAAR